MATLKHQDHPGHVQLTAHQHDTDDTSESQSNPADPTHPPLSKLALLVAPELADCSAPERSFVWRMRLQTIVETWASGISNVASFELVLALCGSDSVVLASHNALISSANSLLATFLSPVVCSLSDAHGRIPFMTLMRSGWLLWLVVAPRVRTLPHRLLAAIVFQGILNVGVNTLSSSAASDLFGFQPSKASKVRAADGVYWNVGQISGLFAGTVLRSFLSNSSLMTLAGALVGVSMAITSTTRETLHVEDRKPFSLAHANPFSNLWLLINPSNGLGLRRLSLASLCSFAASSSIRSILFGYRFDAIGFTPATNASFEQTLSIPGILSQRFFIGRFMGATGNLQCYRFSSLLGVVGYALLSLSHRGATFAQRRLQHLLLFSIVFESFIRAGNYAMYGMFIKQGISCVDDVGKGEINSAFDGLQALTGIVMPLFWSRAYSFFQSRGMPGGAFNIAALLNLVAHLLVFTCPASALYVDEHQIPIERLSHAGQDAIKRSLRAHSLTSSVAAKPGTAQWVFEQKVRVLRSQGRFLHSARSLSHINPEKAT
jgi:MFS family permease